MEKNVDIFYDLFDEAALIHHESLGLNYFVSLIKTAKGICYEEYDSRLDEEKIKKLEALYQMISNQKFYNEEIRLALELLIIKAFKHINYRLDLMTPDTVNYLIAHIINKKFKNREITIIDTLLGTGNLINAICNLCEQETQIIGIEHDANLVELAKMTSELQNNDIRIYFQDALNNIFDLADVIVGDLDSYNYQQPCESDLYNLNVRYFPYLLIEKRLKNLKDNGYFIFVIENDFFAKDQVNVFKNFLNKSATLMGLIVLPKLMFKEGHVGKSILIGRKAVLKSYNMMVLEIPNFEENSLKKTLQNIDRLVEKI